MHINLTHRPSVIQLQQVVELHKLVLTDSVLSNIPHRLLTLIYQFSLSCIPSVLLLLENKDKVLGFLFAFDSFWYGPELQFLGVHPKYQNQGWGTKLITALGSYYAGRGITQYVVGTKPDNLKSNRFYMKLGFIPLGKKLTLGGLFNYYRSPKLKAK